MKKFFPLLFLLCFCCSSPKTEKTVFLTILARNKAHYLPRFLRMIENLDYEKKSITVYINTNDNIDDTEQILEEWIARNKKAYSKIIYEKHFQDDENDRMPHNWTGEKVKKLGQIRNHSLEKARESGCDYYFVVDVDNFIIPSTLKTLINEDKPIIAPLLRSIPEKEHFYTNYFYDIDENGYYREHPNYWHIILNSWIGSFKVPVVHCTYLIKTDYLNQLDYLDYTDNHEFIVFSRNARKAGIDQYICNLKEFGIQFNFHNVNMTLEEEKHITRAFLAIP